MKVAHEKFPEHVAVIGGGRWARVLTEVLCTVVPLSCRITIYTPHNTDNMKTWAATNKLTQHIKVTSNWPDFNKSETHAAIVVNAARDHESAIERLLTASVPVLIEKPVTLTAKATQRLINLAITNETYITSAHIFLYASYLDNFLKLVNNKSDIKELSIIWSDPSSENRYGENKHYDPGLPIIADWFPHILSILSKFCSDVTFSCNSIDIDRGGASQAINITLGNIPCHLKMERNGERRQRILNVKTSDQNFQLDFTVEPGVITFGENTITGDDNWQNIERSSSLMLKSFFKSIINGQIDSRIDIQMGLYANNAIDKSMTLYRRAQAKWLQNKIKSEYPLDEDFQYAIDEIFQADGLLSRTDLKGRLDKVLSVFSGSTDNTHLIQALLESDSPLGFLDTMSEQVICENNVKHE